MTPRGQGRFTIKFRSLQERLEKALIAEPGRFGWTRWVKAAVIVSSITLIGGVLDLRIAPTNLAMLYLLGVIFISYRWGFGPAVMSSLVSTFGFDFLFIPPYESFAVSDTWYVVTGTTLMCITVLTSVLTAAMRRHALNASRREAHTAALYALTQALAAMRRPQDVLHAAARHIKASFGCEIAILLADGSGQLRTALEPAEGSLDSGLRCAAERTFQAAAHDRPAHRQGRFLPLTTAERVTGFIVLMPARSQQAIGNADDVVLEGIAGQVAIAIERAKLEERAREAELLRKTDDLQRTLLNSVSHSLRAPLAAILSAIHPIAEGEANQNAVMELARIAEAEASRLDTLIGNLLDLSRLEAGALEPRLEPYDVRDVIGAALRDLHDARDREISFEFNSPLPFVSIDFALIVNVFVNLLENAAKYSPAGAPIHIEAKLCDEEVEIRIADRGCGIPPQEHDAIFGKFARGASVHQIPGIGLGLPICKGFIEAHKGRIWVEERQGGGSIFCFTLPASDLPDDHSRHAGGALRPTAQSKSWS